MTEIETLREELAEAKAALEKMRIEDGTTCRWTHATMEDNANLRIDNDRMRKALTAALAAADRKDGEKP